MISTPATPVNTPRNAFHLTPAPVSLFRPEQRRFLVAEPELCHLLIVNLVDDRSVSAPTDELASVIYRQENAKVTGNVDARRNDSNDVLGGNPIFPVFRNQYDFANGTTTSYQNHIFAQFKLVRNSVSVVNDGQIFFVGRVEFVNLLAANENPAVAFVDVNAPEASRQNNGAADSGVVDCRYFSGVLTQVPVELSDNRVVVRRV